MVNGYQGREEHIWRYQECGIESARVCVFAPMTSVDEMPTLEPRNMHHWEESRCVVRSVSVWQTAEHTAGER